MNFACGRAITERFLATDKVHQLFLAQLFHDRKQKEQRRGLSREQRVEQIPTDYLRPIIGAFLHDFLMLKGLRDTLGLHAPLSVVWLQPMPTLVMVV